MQTKLSVGTPVTTERRRLCGGSAMLGEQLDIAAQPARILLRFRDWRGREPVCIVDFLSSSTAHQPPPPCPHAQYSICDRGVGHTSGAEVHSQCRGAVLAVHLDVRARTPRPRNLQLLGLCDIYVTGELPRLLANLEVDEDDATSARFKVLAEAIQWFFTFLHESAVVWKKFLLVTIMMTTTNEEACRCIRFVIVATCCIVYLHL